LDDDEWDTDWPSLLPDNRGGTSGLTTAGTDDLANELRLPSDSFVGGLTAHCAVSAVVK